MPLTTIDPVLDRFRDQYAAQKAIYPHVQLYALIDFATMPESRQYAFSNILEPMPRVPLYSNTGLDNLSENGPFLLRCPEPEGVEPLRVHRLLLGLARQDSRVVSWLWTTHEVESLVDHLQTLLHARLDSDGAETWFFFHQPAYLPVLHRTLPDDTRHYMFGPCLEWWCLDSRGELITLAGENLPIPRAMDILPVPENVEEEIRRVGAPAQVLAWLQRARPDVVDNTLAANARLQKITPFVERAFEYGLTGKVDQGVYAATALLYGGLFDEHPALQTVLKQFRHGNETLIDAFMAMGDGVWREVAELAGLRHAETATQEYQAELRERGYASLRVKVLNDTDIRKRKVELESTDGSSTRYTSLGDIDANGFEPAEIEIASAQIPVPGTLVTVRWIGPMGQSSGDAMVTGNLPRAEGEGLAVVKFARDWRVYVRMHADEPESQTRQ